MAHHYRMTNHYRTPVTRTEAPSRAGGSSLPQTRLGKYPKNGISARETVGTLESIEMLRIKHQRDRWGAKGCPIAGHADSITNDEHGSRSDILDCSSPNPITQDIKVNTANPLYFFIIISYIHTRIHSIRPCLPDDSGPEPPGGSRTKHRTCSKMHHNAPCCVTKRQLPHST